MDTPLTAGDLAFEHACGIVGAKLRRIPQASASGIKTPDYSVRTKLCGAFVEVKTIGPNDQDRRRAEGKVYRITPGQRLRSCIRSAALQLSRPSKRGMPTAVAVLDSTGIGHTDPYSVKVAMFGLDAMVIGVPDDMSMPPRRLGWKRAGKATLTKEHNSSISAVVVIDRLRFEERQRWVLYAYHNPFARIPFLPAHLRGLAQEQYFVEEAADGFTDWLPIDASVDV